MPGRKLLLIVLGIAGAAYLVSPYVAVWRLATALQQGDERAVERLIDWNSVRAGLKEDIAEGIASSPDRDDTAASTRLPPFGAGFVSGIADSEIDREFTPQRTLRAFHELEPADVQTRQIGMRVILAALRGGAFVGPSSFVLTLRLPADDHRAAPLRFKFMVRQGTWRLVRAWLPETLLEEVASRT
jgi:hypothetical protein